MQQSYMPETEQQTMYNEFMQGTPVLPSAIPTKADTLAQRKQEKVDVLASKVSSPLLTEGMPHLDSNEYEMGGYLERGGNKLFNTLSDHDMQAILGRAIADYQLQRDVDGSTFYMQNGEKVKYNGDAQFLYGYGNDEGMFKLGISRGDLPSADYRYQPRRAEQEGYRVGKNGYGWAPGPEGLDVENRQMEILLPAEIAKRLEYMYHGREGSLDSRALRKPVEGGAEFDRQRAALGSGYTEYYTSKEGLFGDSRVGKQSDVNELYQQFLSMGQEDKPRVLSKEEIDEIVKQREAENMGFGGRAINTLKAFGAGVVKYGVVHPLDAALELTNLGDLGSEEQTTEMVNKWFGYNDALLDEPMRRAKELASGILEGIKREDKNVDIADVFELVKVGIANTEIMADSLGYVGSLFIPYLGIAGKGLTASKGVLAVEKAYKAGNMSKADALAQIKQLNKQADVVTKSARLLQKEAGLLVVSAGVVNNQIDAYVEEHGESPSLGKIAQMYTTQVVMNGLDKWVTVDILKNTPGLTKAVKEATKSLEVPEYVKLATKMLGIAGVVSVNAGKEAAQEYLQTIGEVVNVQWNFDKDNNVTQAMSSLGDVLIDDKTQIEGIMGAGIGAGVGVDMTLASEAVGVAISPVVANKIREGAAKVSDAMSREKMEVDPEVNEKVNEEVMAAAVENAESIWESIVGIGAEERVSKGELEGVNLKELTTTDLSDAEWNVVTTRLLQSGTPEQLVTVISSLNVGGKSKEAQVLGQKLLESDPNNWNVQGSDPIALEDAVIAAAVARLEAEDSPEMVMNSIKAGIGRGFTEEKVNSIVQEAVQEAEYAKTLKTLGEVSSEASTGSRGFMTYFSKARYGETQEIRDFATGALGKFAKQHEDKLSKVDEAKAKVVNDINNDRMKYIANRSKELKEDPAYKNAPASLKTAEYEDMLLDMVAYKKLAVYYGGSEQTSGKKGANTVKVDYGSKNAEGTPYAFKIGKWTVAEELHDNLVTQLKEIEPKLNQNYRVIDKAKKGYLDTYKALQGEVEAMQGLLGNLLNRDIREVPAEARVIPEPTQEKPIKQSTGEESVKEQPVKAEVTPKPAQEKPAKKPAEENPVREQTTGEPVNLSEGETLDIDSIPDPMDFPDEGDIPSVESIPDNVFVDMDVPVEGDLDFDPSEFTLEWGIEGYEDILSMVDQQEAEAADKTPSFVDTITEDIEVPEVITSSVAARLEAQRDKMKEKIKEARSRSKEYNDWEKSVDSPVDVENSNLVARDPSYVVSLIEEALGDNFVEALLDNRLKAMQEKAPGRDYSRTIDILRNRYIDVQNKLADELRKLGCK